LKSLLSLIVAFTLTASVCRAQFFPKSSLDSRGDAFKANWYSGQLRALKEASLLPQSVDPLLPQSVDHQTSHSYRFLWLRTFNHPIAVRIDIQPDGTGTLSTKVTSGAGGYAPGNLIEDTSRPLSGSEVKSFLALVDRTSFWTAPNPINDQAGNDGSQWIIEGVEGAKYHVIDRWTPKSGAAYELGKFLAFDLAKMDIPKREIY
jgi:hypothetical protein